MAAWRLKSRSRSLALSPPLHYAFSASATLVIPRAAASGAPITGAESARRLLCMANRVFGGTEYYRPFPFCC